MKNYRITVPIAALALALGAFAAEAQDRAERRSQRGQGQGQNQEQERRPSGATARQGGPRAERPGQPPNRARANAPAPRRDNEVARGGRGYGRSGNAAPRPDYDQGRSGDHGQSYGGGGGRYYGGGSSYGRGYPYPYGYSGGRGYRGGYYGGHYRGGYGYSRYYYAPRPLPFRHAPARYYGSGGRLSVYFGFGSGYLYGSVYSGPVYGYREAVPVYGSRRYYGDVRLQVNPRDAAVYVDGYYAGIVDDFDGSSRPLVLEAGAHKIEIAAPGVEPQVFDVYVDPQRSVDLHADLLRYGR